MPPYLPLTSASAPALRRLVSPKSGFQLREGGGSIEPPKTGVGGVREQGSIDRTIHQLL